ncbi:Phosphatidylethanolamine-binding protein [uncultured virus]|nr:Phosphatidylethanolamine-binding protein [uncultured virus]
MRLTARNINISFNTWGPLADLDELGVAWDVAPGMTYTLIIYDVDAPSPDDSRNSPFLHLLLANIPGNNIAASTVIAPYMPPNPPTGSGQHRYMIVLYNQKFLIPMSNIVERERFDLNGFINRYNLTLIDSDTIVVDSSTQQYYRMVGERTNDSKVTINTEYPLIMGTSTLSIEEKKYCGCVVDAASHQPGACNLEKAWFEERDGRICANPFAVCAKSTGGSNRNCSKNWNYAQMSDKQLTALANLFGISLGTPINRMAVTEMLRAR